ncbi:MAG: ABC transporter ATP-binding protein [Alcanivoracaceae bacterium]|nr:ABC transporter ATP-binding protein [Alcanivoracaceae bacterium]
MKNISINNLTIQYDDLMVIENFNAEFSTGIHWIQGFNGSGKSSLLKSLCGIVTVDKDVVKINAFDLNTQAIKAKSQLCFVADKPDVYPFMTGLQFLKLIAKIKGVKLNDELFAFMQAINLEQFKDMAFSQMSFGTRRKFTLCSVFIGNPPVVLLDEPFNGLDKHTTEQFRLWLVKARKEKCILIVSHDTHILETLHDSVLVLD